MNTFAIKMLAAASLSILAVAPAAAEDLQVAVAYGDLDLASPAGAQQLATRLQVGIETACARPEIREIKAMAAWSACKDAAKAGAVEQLARHGAPLSAI